MLESLDSRPETPGTLSEAQYENSSMWSKNRFPLFLDKLFGQMVLCMVTRGIGGNGHAATAVIPDTAEHGHEWTYPSITSSIYEAVLGDLDVTFNNKLSSSME